MDPKEQETQEQPKDAEQVDYAAEAAREGWVPKDQWRGDEAQWIDAQEFVERGKQVLPIVNAKLRRANQRIEELTSTVTQFKPFMDRAIASERAQKEAAIAELEKVRAKAITDGDGDTFNRADAEINRRRAESAQPEAADPALNQWLSENNWYGADTAMTVYADHVGQTYRDRFPNASPKDVLDHIGAEVKAEYPHKFRAPAAVEGSAPKAPEGRGKKKGYADLPDDAKKACDQFCKDIPGFTKDTYLENYDWS